MNDLKYYEVLEKCLLDLEQGADIDTVLFRYPDLAEELRPILEASVKAKRMIVPAPSSDVVRRNRARLLQRAAEMREGKVKPVSRGVWLTSLRRVAVTLIILVLVFLSGTGLVRAASTTLPGDNLYPVKRTWEGVLVLFTFDPQAREVLEVEHENERLEELRELLAEGRSAEVDFAGYVTSQTGTEWQISGFPVVISDQTRMPDQPVGIGAAVRVRGQTQGDGIVIAERIELLPAGAILPEVEEDESGFEEENHEGQNPQIDDNSNTGSGNDTPRVEDTKTPESESEPESSGSGSSESESNEDVFNGTVDSIDEQTNIWTINGLAADVSNAEINGEPVVGSTVKMEGYYGADGKFIVKKVEFVAGGSGNENDSDSNNNNSNDDNSNDDHGDSGGGSDD